MRFRTEQCSVVGEITGRSGQAKSPRGMCVCMCVRFWVYVCVLIVRNICVSIWEYVDRMGWKSVAAEKGEDGLR